MLKDSLNRGVYANNVDMYAIMDAAQIEVDMLNEAIQNIFNDAFPVIATAAGALKWENILGIVHDPATEALDFRRGRIINRLIGSTPYTERMLIEIMDNIMGKNGWSYNLDYRNYTLDITSLRPGNNWLTEMEATLRKIIPANIVYNLHIYYVSWRRVYEDFANWEEIYESGKTWQDVLEGV